jgi:thiamine biosynthesis lipoprotein
MTSCSKSEVRRCRPLLGTFVEITACGAGLALMERAVGDAFGTIEAVQRLMSVHDEGSELSQLNRRAHLEAVPVSAPTFAVLQRALTLAHESEGAFDFTMGATLARWAMRPRELCRRTSGTWRDVELRPDNCVRFGRPLAVDLGGIAKGFAVDCAIAVLRECNVPSGLVNAGGDLRVFGDETVPVHLRHPGAPRRLVRSVELHDAALATSSPCFTRRRWRGRLVSHLVRQDRRSAITRDISVSVRARECWAADALTKVVLNAPPCAERLLAQYDAEAFVLTA